MSGNFADGVDAATESGDHGKFGFWFFKGDQALKTDSDGERIEYGPGDITAADNWPALRGTRFANGPVEAAVFSGSGFWFFQGSYCVKTDPKGNDILVAPSPITAPGNWPALAGTPFQDGVDAVVASGDHGKFGFWFLKGGQALKTDPKGERVEHGPSAITAAENWPALTGTRFASGIDASVFSGSGFWFFQGGHCVKTDPKGNEIIVPDSLITAAGNWPAIRGH
ncbi:hypothetical protein [Streptomyces sp. UNOC14_S4]|uniref:hypothetical protein n=1 Tax=Streptomyces sp. UNOC14_S4 TaxID=2872340 RepID=UPI001E603A8A|nr:hypothetical protein [Streptomyces sp. UNOC14_S4]MCC3767842.1 hypothetical protein [Streptomyces sp. UNOC14_S4]